MSLRRKIMGSIVLVVVLTVLVSIGVGYYATQSRLGVFVDRIGGEEAVQIARLLSREYTAADGWGRVDSALSEAGYIYDGAPLGEHSSKTLTIARFRLLKGHPLADLGGRARRAPPPLRVQILSF